MVNYRKLKAFFLWCTIINGCLLALSTIVFILAPEAIFQIHSKLLPVSQETYNNAIYLFLGLFKIIWLTFTLVPYVALRVIGDDHTD